MRALDIANAFIVSHADDGFITNMKLNKLVYFAYATALRDGVTLFDDEIEAWQYGAVIPEVYSAFSRYRSQKIDTPTYMPPKDAFKYIQRIWSAYGSLTAIDIMKFSHRDGGAWIKVYGHSKAITDSDILASSDGVDMPDIAHSLSAAMSRSVKRYANVLERLATS